MQQLKTNIGPSKYINLILILMLQLVLCIYFGNEKYGFHEDEIATYALSNSPDGIWPTWGINQWKSGTEYKNSFLINENSKFSYTMVYGNQERDVHPPLYYIIIHSISSFVPGVFSKWIGLIPNIIFALLTAILVWLISIDLIKNDNVALATTGFYAFSVGTLSTVSFIRMYAMLTFFCTLLVLIHIHLANELLIHKQLRKKDYIALLLCTIIGILTQYYFMIFCFFLCGCFALGLFLIKKWKQLFLYVTTEFGALIISLIVFPRMFYHCFEGYRGKEALTNAAHSEQTVEVLRKVASIISNQVSNGYCWELCVIILCASFLLLINYFLLHCEIHFDKKEFSTLFKINLFLTKEATWVFPFKSFIYLSLIIIISGYIILVSRIAPYQTDRYYMCLYPLIYIVISHALFVIISHIFKNKTASSVLIILLLLICTMGHLQQSINYIYNDYQEREKLIEYNNLPVIILNGTYNWYPERWIYEYMNHPAVFRTDAYCDLSIIPQALNSYDLSTGFLLYSCRMNVNEDELFREIEKYIGISSHEQIVKVGDPVYFCTID